jgi:glucan 1,4-alpha-glucosidase
MKTFFLSVSILLFQVLSAQTYTISSPDSRLKLRFSLGADGIPVYALDIMGRPVVGNSKLGISIKDDEGFTKGLKIIGIDSAYKDEKWNTVWGEERTIRNNYRELGVNLQQSGGKNMKIRIVFRLFNAGLGFRYEFPEQPSLQYFIVSGESTQFNLGANHKAFWIPGDYDTNEYPYTESRLSEVDAIAKGNATTEISTRSVYAMNAVQTPLMMKADNGLFINIHEAALVQYPAMDLLIDAANGFTLTTDLVPDALGNKAYKKAPSTTPWRVINVSDKATDILASRIILNLNEPSAISNTSWIKPQKFVGVWWEMHVGKSTWDYSGTQNASTTTVEFAKPSGKHGANTANVKRYIDFAAKNGIDGVLVEGWNTGWEDWFGKWKEDVFDFVTPYPDYDLNELNGYAKSKGVKIVMHNETSSAVTSYERQMDTAFRLMKNQGNDLVKTGYVGRIIPRGEWHDGQWMVDHYMRVVKKAAGYHIMVDAHESVRLTGLQRTYPNWMASEAARGNEFNAWSVGNPPAHETILPFTRLMGGPMDYTPGIFETQMKIYDSTKKTMVHTTLVKQLALYVTMYSPVQMAADLPENYERYPDAFQFIKDVAVDWDSSVYLAAEPGDYLTIARKAKGRPDWFIGAITDENARSSSIKLDFLPSGKFYEAVIYQDGKTANWETNPKSYQISKQRVSSTSVIPLRLAPGGGTAIYLRAL